MHNVAIIGAGQLGSRHLQAILQSNYDLNIYVSDPSSESLEISKERAGQIIHKNKNINYIESSTQLPEDLTFVVVATNANVRLKVIEDLVKKSSVKYLVLEKVLFTNETEYEKALNIFKENNIDVFVNCPRRMFPFYQELRRKLSKENKIDFSYSGGEWGLACNSVHMLDLYSYLSNNYITDINCDLLTNVVESKRPGYCEVLGVLSSNESDGPRLLLKSTTNNVNNILEVSSEGLSVIIYETLGKAIIIEKKDNWESHIVDFNVIYQSNLTNIVFESLLNNGICDLTTYDESMKIHLPFIKSMTDYFSNNNIDGCPIT